MKNEEREGGGGRGIDEKAYARNDLPRHQVVSGSHPEDSLGSHSKKSQKIIGHIGPKTTSNECEALGGIPKKRPSEGGDSGTTSEPDGACDKPLPPVPLPMLSAKAENH